MTARSLGKVHHVIGYPALNPATGSGCRSRVKAARTLLSSFWSAMKLRVQQARATRLTWPCTAQVVESDPRFWAPRRVLHPRPTGRDSICSDSRWNWWT